jgi:hypothetical protein
MKILKVKDPKKSKEFTNTPAVYIESDNHDALEIVVSGQQYFYVTTEKCQILINLEFGNNEIELIKTKHSDKIKFVRSHIPKAVDSAKLLTKSERQKLMNKKLIV